MPLNNETKPNYHLDINNNKWLVSTLSGSKRQKDPHYVMTLFAYDVKLNRVICFWTDWFVSYTVISCLQEGSMMTDEPPPH